MSPILSAEGETDQLDKLSHTDQGCTFSVWITEQKSAIIYISIDHKKVQSANLYFAQFVELKNILHNTLKSHGIGSKIVSIDGRLGQNI